MNNLDRGMLVSALIRFKGFSPVEALKEVDRIINMNEQPEGTIWKKPKKESRIDKFNKKYNL